MHCVLLLYCIVLHCIVGPGEVTFDGDIRVFGSVAGSGPYVDSSDRRFKKNIEVLSGERALQMVGRLQAVRIGKELP